jgi:pyridoxamine 5'-phosphate oxidase
MPAEVVRRVAELLARAGQLPLSEPTAMTLATADRQGRVSARVVLLRGFDARGFVFFTNTLSDKGRQLAENPHAALCFYWDGLAEQLRVEGSVAFVTPAEADAYWAARPRDRQLGAWASLQSQPLSGFDLLEQRYREFQQQFAAQPVPRPPHWTGYRVLPDRVEFWKGRDARLHERVVFELGEEGWRSGWVYP